MPGDFDCVVGIPTAPTTCASQTPANAPMTPPDEPDQRDFEPEERRHQPARVAPMACMMAISPRRSIMVVAVRLQTVRPAESSAASVMSAIRPPMLVENFAFGIGHAAHGAGLRAGERLLDLVRDRVT